MGGGAGVPGLCGQLAAHLGVPVEPLRPVNVVACPVEIEERCRHSLASLALGLALHSE
jgi:Tfp pilus assembly PilM family ATPase